jgi:anaerobic selenocysteine-containing dehydrogenase
MKVAATTDPVLFTRSPRKPTWVLPALDAVQRVIGSVPPAAAAELPDPEFAFVLDTGRLLYHWHGGTIARRGEGVLELAPRPRLEINPSDARRLGIAANLLTSSVFHPASKVPACMVCAVRVERRTN